MFLASSQLQVWPGGKGGEKEEEEEEEGRGEEEEAALLRKAMQTVGPYCLVHLLINPPAQE